MKTITQLFAIAILVASYQVGMAQSNEGSQFNSVEERKAYLKAQEQKKGIPQFNSDEEKQAWIDANPEKYATMLKPKAQVAKQKIRVQSDKIKATTTNQTTTSPKE